MANEFEEKLRKLLLPKTSGEVLPPKQPQARSSDNETAYKNVDFAFIETVKPLFRNMEQVFRESKDDVHLMDDPRGDYKHEYSIALTWSETKFTHHKLTATSAYVRFTHRPGVFTLIPGDGNNNYQIDTANEEWEGELKQKILESIQKGETSYNVGSNDYLGKRDDGIS